MNTKQVHVVVFLVIGICGPLWGMSMPIDIGDSLPAGVLVNTWPDYVVTAGGADIWGTADQFTYCYHKGPENLDFWTGDFTAIVGVKSMEPSDTSDWWAKAGIMARETLDAGSRHTMIVRSLKNGASMQYRDYTDSSSGSASLQGQYGPEDMVWLRLDRKGDAFIGSYAVGGSTVPTEWRAAAYHILPMPDDVYVGLATTSHQQDTAVTVEYISFQVGQLNPNLAILEPELCDIGGIEMGSMRIREVIDKGNIWGQGACFESLASGGGTIVDYTAPVLDIWDRDGSGHYWGGDHFGVVTAGHRTLGSVDHASMLVRGIIRIPQGEFGLWTFGVNSDDGFTLQFPGHDFLWLYGEGWIVPFTTGGALQFYENRGAADTLGVIDLPAGNHPFWLTYHEGHLGASVEFFAAQGEHTQFDPQVFRPVGYKSVGGMNVPGLVGNVYIVGTDPGMWIGGQIDNLQDARDAFDEIDLFGWYYPYVNHADLDNPGSGGIFGGDEPFPFENAIPLPGEDDDDFAVLVTGDLDIPADGTYQIGFNSDDGASLEIFDQNWDSIIVNATGASVIAGDQLICDTTTGSSLTVGEIDLTAGQYPFELWMFERDQGSFLELFAGTVGGPVLIEDGGAGSRPDFDGLQLVCPTPLGDLNLDCRVNLADVALMGGNWLLDCVIDPGQPACTQP